MPRVLTLALLLVGMMLVTAPAAADPFSGGKPSAPPAAAAGEGAAASGAPWSVGDLLPAVMKGWLARVAQVQRTVRRDLAGYIRDYRERGALLPLVLLFGLSFVYGLLHAVGPGHGKAVVATWFAAREARLRDGMSMAALIAFTQALAGIVVVSVLALIFGGRQSAVMENSLTLELASYALIVVIGLGMLVHGVYEWLRPPVPEDAAHLPAAAHDVEEVNRPLYARLNHWLGEGWSVGIAAGIRPCSGSLIVMLFTLANGVFFLGILAALVMGLGVMLTIAVAGMATILARRTLAAAPVGARVGAWMGHAVTLGGATLIMLMGVTLFLAAWQRDMLLG